MLSGYTYDVLIQRLTKELSTVPVDDGIVWLNKDVLKETVTISISFTIYGKPHRVDTVFNSIDLRRLPTGAEFYYQMYQTTVANVASYLNKVDRTETWELVPKT